MNMNILATGILSFCFCFGKTGIEMVKKADTMRYIETDNSSIVEVTDYKGSNIQRSRYKVYSKGAKMSIVETIYPERQAGRKLLMKDDDLWFFTPDIKRATRVSMKQRLTGEVANGDLARTNFGDDYFVEIKGNEVVNGVRAIHLTLKKNKSEVTYPIVEYWVSEKENAPLKSVFKSDGGKELKVATYSLPKEMLGRKILTKIEIVNALNKKQKSILIFKDYKKENLNDSFFNKESLNN